jgi:hypothetical protein
MPRVPPAVPEPGENLHSLILADLGHALADLLVTPGHAFIHTGDDAGHQGDVEFGNFSGGIGKRENGHVQRALEHGFVLGTGLEKCRRWKDLERQRAAGGLRHLLPEFHRQVVTRIRFGELMRNLQLRRRCQGRCQQQHSDTPERRGHHKSTFACFSWIHFLVSFGLKGFPIGGVQSQERLGSSPASRLA